MTDILDINIPATEPGNATQPQPKQERRGLTLPEITSVASRLSDVLAKENQFLIAMKIKEVAELQEEKNKLIAALDIQKKILALDPTIKLGFTQDDIREFEHISLQFEENLKENYRQLLRVKEINRKVVETIAKAIAENTTSQTGYNPQGTAAAPTLQNTPLSVSQDV